MVAPTISTIRTTAIGWPSTSPLAPLPFIFVPAKGMPLRRAHKCSYRWVRESPSGSGRGAFRTFAAGDFEQQGTVDDEARRKHPGKGRDQLGRRPKNADDQ